MTQFISTKFFLTIQEASQNNTDVCDNALKIGYEEFASLIFSEGKSATNKADYHGSLQFTYIELSCLSTVSKKKCSCLS